MDYDRDGFLNIEEFKNGTKLDDPESMPSLGYLLRVVKVERRNLPIRLVDIDTNRKDDPKQWDVIVMAQDPKTKKDKRFMRSIGDKVGGFVILEAGFTGTGDLQTPFAVVAMESAPAEKYRLEKDKEVPSKRLTVRLMYLATRDINYSQYVMSRCVFTKEVGEEFPLEKAKTTSKVKEFFRLISADEKDGSAKVALLKSEKGAVDKEIQLERFRYREDFISYDAMNMNAGMMGPGAEVGPGPGMQEGGRRPNRRQNRRME